MYGNYNTDTKEVILNLISLPDTGFMNTEADIFQRLYLRYHNDMFDTFGIIILGKKYLHCLLTFKTDPHTPPPPNLVPLNTTLQGAIQITLQVREPPNCFF